jgi:RNA polymerase sigma factor (TIGR02999 family)
MPARSTNAAMAPHPIGNDVQFTCGIAPCSNPNLPVHVGAVGEITLLLQRSHRGDAHAANELLQLVYAELRRLAAAKLNRERAGHTLQPTALVHEAWLRLGGDAQPSWQNRRHFFAAAAEAMRRVLVEQARRRSTVRRGGGAARLNTEDFELPADTTPEQLLAVSDALEKFAAVDARRAELVKLRYFGGLSIDEAAQAMEISATTANRWWTFARAWLFDELNGRNGK